jgi:hypothetical protein
MSGAEGSSRQHFSGRVYTAGEPCGGQRTCVRQNRVVLAVVATVKLLRRRQSRQPARCRRISLERGRPERTRLPGEHGISRPTTAQGRPSDWLHLYAAVRFFCVCFRAADRGCQPAPGLPCALLIERVERVSKARAKSAARMRRCVCKLRCGLEDGDDAPCSVIASAAKQSRVFPRRDSGLLRCARNDDCGENFTRPLRSRATPDMRKRPWGAGAFRSRLGVGVVYISTWRLWGAGKEPREFEKLVKTP